MQNIDLASFSFDYSEIVKGAAEVKRSIDELKQEQKDLVKEGKGASEQYVQNAADLKTLNGVYNQHVKYLADASKETLGQTVRTEALNQVLEQEATTIKGLRDQNKILNQLRNSANLTTEEGRLELEQLNAKLDENNQRIKENVDQYTQQKINVGNYTQSIKQAFAEMEKEKKALEEKNEALALMQEETKEGTKEWAFFNQQIQQNNQQINILVTNMGGVNEEMQASSTVTKLLSGDFKGLSENAKAAGGTGNLLISTLRGIATSIMGVVKASLAFIATPIGAVIAAVGLVLGAIVNYLKSTQEGMDMVTKVTRPLSAVFQALVGILQDVGKFLFEAFSRPQETLKALYDFVKNQLMRQFESFGKILEGIFTLDFGLIKEGFTDLAEQAKENLDLIAGAGKAMTDRMKEAYRAGVEIDRLQKEIEQSEIDIINSRAKNTLALKEQETLMENQLASSKERSAAIEEHKRLTLALIAEEEEIIKKKIRQLELQQSLNDTTREQQKELAELQAQLISNEEKRTEAEKKANTVIKTLRDEQNAAAQKAVDQRIKKESELIDLYVQQQGIQSRTLSEQLEMERAVSEMKLNLLDSELKAKKISQEQYAREVLAIQQNLKRMEAEIAVDAAQRELQAYKRGFEEQMNERRFLSDEVAKNKIKELDDLLAKEEAFALLQLEKGLLNKQEYDDKIAELGEANRIAVDEVKKEREAVEKEEALELRALEFEEELERMLAENATRFEIEQAQIQEQFSIQKSALDDQLRNQEISQELYDARLAKLRRDRTNAEIANEEALAEEKFKLATDLFDAAASFIDKDSKAGKAIALAKAGINMYQGISAGVALGFPAAIPAVAFATSTGLKAIKDITSTKVPSASGSGSAGGSMSSPVSSAMNLSGQGVNLGSANSNVQNQVEQNANAANANEQMAEAVQAGAKAGTEQGSQEGITNLSANREIMNQSAF